MSAREMGITTNFKVPFVFRKVVVSQCRKDFKVQLSATEVSCDYLLQVGEKTKRAPLSVKKLYVGYAGLNLGTFILQ